MTRYFLTVAGMKHYLQPGEDLDRLAHRLISAAHTGDVVQLTTADARRLHIDATSNTPIVIESEPETPPQPIHPREHVNMLDADLF